MVQVEGQTRQTQFRRVEDVQRDGRGRCINMWAVGAQVHFSWLPRLRFFPLFESSPRCLRTHRICNQFRIVMLDSYRRRRPAHPFCVVTLVSYRPFWIVTVSPISCCCTHLVSPILDRCCLARFVSSHSSCIAHFGSLPSRLFRVVTLISYHRFWIVTLLWQIIWATQKLSSDTLGTCFLLGKMGTSRRQSRRASLLR